MALQASEIRQILGRLGVVPYKGWGQHFLTDPDVPRRMVALAGVGPGNTVVEIGPGLGVLTEPLVGSGATVIAVEIDARLAVYLRERFAHQPYFRLIEDDILRLPLDSIAPGDAPVTIVANLPYSATSAVLRHLLAGPRRPTRLVVMVQAEVADRIVAGPPAMSLLAVSIQLYGRPRLALRVPADSFTPRPTVDSAVIVIDSEPSSLAPDEDAAFFRIVAAGFAQRRKTLANSLSAALARPRPSVEITLAAAEIDGRRRAQTLTVEEWIRLYRAFAGRSVD